AQAGARTDVAGVERRAYQGLLDCGAIDPDAPPDSPEPPRAVDAFGHAMGWQLPAGEGYTVIAWAVHATSGRAIAFGCAALAPAQVAPGPLAVTLAVA